VEFISRSCADEYLKQKTKIEKTIVEVNMSPEICAMFNNVKRQYSNEGYAVSFDVCPSPSLIMA
jgi:hypothetical protein